MKKKSLYLFMALVLLPAMILLNACSGTLSCSLCTCTIQFETWGGSTINDIYYQAGDQLDPNNFREPSKTGYKFLNWCYDEDLERAISFPMFAAIGTYTYYAKYEIDTTYFTDTSLIQWSNTNSETVIGDYSASYKTCILFEKTNMKYAFNKIVIEPITDTPGQGFLCSSFVVYDENGKPVEDVNSDTSTFEPESPSSQLDTFSYVLVITPSRGGDFRVTIS